MLDFSSSKIRLDSKIKKHHHHRFGFLHQKQRFILLFLFCNYITIVSCFTIPTAVTRTAFGRIRRASPGVAMTALEKMTTATTSSVDDTNTLSERDENVDVVNSNNNNKERRLLLKNQANDVETDKLKEWRKAQIAAFKESVLNECYLQQKPVRLNTIEASKLYSSKNKTSLMPGSHKHLGGAYDPTDGCIYGVPANSQAVLCLYPKNDNNNDTASSYSITCIPLPTDQDNIKDYKMKWLRGIFAHGYLWAIPAWAPCVLCVDVDAFWNRRNTTTTIATTTTTTSNNIVQYLPLPKEHPKDMTWQWHGAGINEELTAIYCIPSNAHSVLKVDLMTKTTSLIPIEYDSNLYPDFALTLVNKWYGGIRGNDNAVYGIPYRASAVLRIDCKTDKAALVGPDFGINKYNWHGGLKIAKTGKIYAHPSHAPDTVLVIDTNKNSNDDDFIYELPIRRATYDTDTRQNYKWLGGIVGADGHIYCPACDTSSVLKINTITEECTTFGFAGSDKNKWQGGILGRDDCIYCIPANGRFILRIATSPSISEIGILFENPVQLIGNMPPHKDKWQGGHVGKDGALYFIPENGYRVMKVTPPLKAPELINGKLPENDVKIEML